MPILEINFWLSRKEAILNIKKKQSFIKKETK